MIEMKEQLISFETAKLAKEKGFDISCIKVYVNDGWLRKSESVVNMTSINLQYYAFAPTQSLLQKWLRERHNIVAWVESMYFDGLKYIPGYEFKIFDFFDNIEAGEVWDLIFDKNHDSYEEALEKILFEALKLIK